MSHRDRGQEAIDAQGPVGRDRPDRSRAHLMEIADHAACACIAAIKPAPL